MYNAIERSVKEYLCRDSNENITAAVCERIFDVWCKEGYLTPERIGNILLQYSRYSKQDDILEWYRSFQDQIIKDDILHPMFMMNNMQLSGELQKEQDKKIDQMLSLLQDFLKDRKEEQQEYPEYLSDFAADIDSFYVNRMILEMELWNQLVLSEVSVLLCGIGGIGKTETAKAVLKKIYSLP